MLFFYLAKALKMKRGRLAILLAKAKNKGKCSCFTERFEEHKSDSPPVPQEKKSKKDIVIGTWRDIFAVENFSFLYEI